MRFGDLSGPQAGVSVPLFSLRSARSAGVGQFTDIESLARFCACTGLGVIQLLPLNDTGENPSPYSALSAFALNPVYLDLLELPGAAGVRREVEAIREELEERPRFCYGRVRELKLGILRRLYAAHSGPGLRSELEPWMAARPWVMPYAAFAASRELAGGRPWWEWPAESGWSAATGARLFASLGERALFHVWVQREAERQLERASEAAERLGVRIKGDLPIMMSRDSADVWASPECFDLDYQAGAPPDMFSPEGQNWGFPPYRWEALERQGYRFWRDRIRHAGRFYHAIRIDHVLGFLRIWRVSATERSGVLGHFHPQRPMRREELAAFLDDGRIAWLSVPHVSGRDIDAALGEAASGARERLFVRLPGEDLYHLRPEIDSEGAIERLREPQNVRAFLLDRHRDRALVSLGAGSFAASWYYARSSSFLSLTQAERDRLEGLVRSSAAESERIWESGGRRLLSMLRESTDMLICAEDLGVVPDCLPRILSELGILSLKIERWARDWTAPGQPLIPPASYPRLSVCSPSVHDTSTLRGHWEESGWDREAYYRSLGLDGPCPDSLTPPVCRAVLARAMGSASLLAITQLQDYLALIEELRSGDPSEERVNVPGTVGERNWSYRIPRSIEELAAHEGLGRAIREVVGARAAAGGRR